MDSMINFPVLGLLIFIKSNFYLSMCMSWEQTSCQVTDFTHHKYSFPVGWAVEYTDCIPAEG